MNPLLHPFFLFAAEASQGGFSLGLASMSGWVERQINESANPATGLAMLFLGGLLASLLPCVYPLYPITATIVRNCGAMYRCGCTLWPTISG